MSKKKAVEANPYETPAAHLAHLCKNFDTARDTMIADPKPSQAIRDAVQGHGLALYDFMKTNRAHILAALQMQDEYEAFTARIEDMARGAVANEAAFIATRWMDAVFEEGTE